MLHLAAQVHEAAAAIREQWKRAPRVGIILGTGIGPLTDEIETGHERRAVPGLGRLPVATIAASDLKPLAEAGEAVVVDLDTSIRYRDGHIPGAFFAVRANLARTVPEMLAQVPQAKQVALVSPDGVRLPR